MRLWNSKRAHIDDLYMISIVYFDWNIYCFNNEIWARASLTVVKEIWLDVMDGLGCIRHEAMREKHEKRNENLLECGELRRRRMEM